MDELDVTALPRGEKHPTIHARLRALKPGQTLRIFNDHDPRPLRLELEADYPGAYSWTYVEAGPEVWRVDLTRVTPAGA